MNETSRKNKKPKIVIGLSVVVVLALLAVGGISWTASSKLLAPDQAASPTVPDGIRVEDVSFQSADGVELSGWYIPAACPDTAACLPAPGIVLSHGRGSNRGAFADEIPALHSAGFALLAFDYRGMGSSDRSVDSTAGAEEQLDLDAAIATMLSKPSVRGGGVALYGKSQGATTALLTAVDNQNVSAVVDESGFASLDDVVGYNFEDETGLPAFPFAPLALFFAEQRADVDLDQIAPIRNVSQLSPRPLLVVHARDDQRVRYEESEKIFAAAGEPKQFWSLEGDSHAEAFAADRNGWTQNVLAFLQRWSASTMNQPS